MADTTAPGILAGKRGLIMGVANNRSIAWGIAQAARRHGAELAFTYQGDALKKRVEPLAKELDAAVVGHCDVTDGATIDAVFAEVGKLWGKLDFVVHCIAFSDKDELTGRYVETSEANFTRSLLISCYSFTAIAQRAETADDERRLASDADLLRRREVDAALQRHGRRQGRPGGVRALSGGRSRPEEHPGQRHLGRPDQDPRGLRDRRLPLHPQVERVQLAAAPDGDDRGGRRDGGLPRLRHVPRRHRRDPPRGCRLPRRRHEEPRGPRPVARQRGSVAEHGRPSTSSATAKRIGISKAVSRARGTFRSTISAASRPRRRGDGSRRSSLASRISTTSRAR